MEEPKEDYRPEAADNIDPEIVIESLEIIILPEKLNIVNLLLKIN